MVHIWARSFCSVTGFQKAWLSISRRHFYAHIYRIPKLTLHIKSRRYVTIIGSSKSSQTNSMGPFSTFILLPHRIRTWFLKYFPRHDYTLDAWIPKVFVLETYHRPFNVHWRHHSTGLSGVLKAQNTRDLRGTDRKPHLCSSNCKRRIMWTNCPQWSSFDPQKCKDFKILLLIIPPGGNAGNRGSDGADNNKYFIVGKDDLSSYFWLDPTTTADAAHTVIVIER